MCGMLVSEWKGVICCSDGRVKFACRGRTTGGLLHVRDADMEGGAIICWTNGLIKEMPHLMQKQLIFRGAPPA